MLGAAREAACGGHAKRRDFPRIRATPASLASRATTASPRTARRSAPRAKARGAVTPSGETALARYNNHPLRASLELALRAGCGLRPGPTTTKRARRSGPQSPNPYRPGP